MKLLVERKTRTGGVLALSATVLLAAALTSPAASVTYNITADGIKEVNGGGTPGQGDLDGSASGTLTLDNGTGSGSTGFATFNLTLANLDLTGLSGHHIHQAPATTTGPIVISFGDPDTIRSGSTLSGTISNLDAATINSAMATPSNFYYNLHNGPFPGGAVRDQLVPVPEPTGFGLLAAGALGLLLRRRRA